MPTTIYRTDPRFTIASRTRNARFPVREADAAGRVVVCDDAEDVARALQATIDTGLRPTVRSSGHCYEDFVANNPQGAILDVSRLDRITSSSNGKAPWRIGPGTMLGHAYEQLYMLGNVTIPGGTCYTVTAGGHVSGGGYGTLARLHGLTVDWVSAMEIVTVDRSGKAVARRVDKMHDAGLFRALRGGQGSNFGIITAFEFAELPPMPQEVILASLSWDWKDMTEHKFVNIMLTYGRYLEESDRNRETWGLFTGLYLRNKDSGRVHLSSQYTVATGAVTDLSVVYDFLDRFQHCQPAAAEPNAIRNGVPPTAQMGTPFVFSPGDTICYGQHVTQRKAWLESTVEKQPGSPVSFGDRPRAKYKSCYRKRNFTEEEARVYYRMMTGDATRGIIVSIDGYGGATNNPDRVLDTSIPQRTSVMKEQYMSFWQRPEDDAYHLNGMRALYAAVHSTPMVDPAHLGTPFPNDHYDGCYINYPDVDTLEHSYWPQLYYGTGELYPFLQEVKRTYDPHNIFHHAMAIRA